MSIISAALGALTSFLSKDVVNRYQTAKKLKKESEILEKEVKSLEIADRLIKDGYYNQSLFESYKILKLEIYKVLTDRNIVFRKGSFFELMNITKRYQVFSDAEIEKINEIRMLRNEIAHNVDFKATREDAEEALKVAKAILSSGENTKIPARKTKNKYFKGTVVANLKKAKNLSYEHNKPIFGVIYNNMHPSKSKLDYSLGYFMEYETTKDLVQNNFVQALIDVNSEGAENLLPVDNPLENALLTIIAPNGEILRQEEVYANPDEGLKRVKEIIANWNKRASS